jgi:hypothetical protein
MAMRDVLGPNCATDPRVFALRRDWERGCQVTDREELERWLNRAM